MSIEYRAGTLVKPRERIGPEQVELLHAAGVGDAKVPGMQATTEKVFSYLAVAAAGAQYIHYAFGLLDKTNTFCPLQAVLDDAHIGMVILQPLLVDADIPSKGKFVIATVEGDLHDIGKNIVATLLQGAGFEVEDLGTSISADKIVQAVSDTNAQFVGLSALLTTTMEHMQEVIENLQEAGVRDQVKVLVGGAPVSAEFAEKIGADFYCEDAFDAIGKLEKSAAAAG